MPVTMDNVSVRLQRYLGLQQAQTIQAEDLSADAIARLTGRRGDLSNVLALWDRSRWKDLVFDYRPDRHDGVLEELLRVLDATMVVQRERGNGRPKTFLPMFPEIVSAQRVSTLYRELGQTVMDGLWRPSDRQHPGLLDALRMLIAKWPDQHPLARLLRPHCKGVDAPSPEGDGNFARAVRSDPALHRWVEKVVTEDWTAYLEVAPILSSDEQLEMMNALIGLHLHVALLYRLRGPDSAALRPVFFVAATRTADDDRTCDRVLSLSFLRDPPASFSRNVSPRSEATRQGNAR